MSWKEALPENMRWEDVVSELSRIRDSGEYTTEDVDFVRQQLQSEDVRVRAAACLAASGCLFEPNVLDLVIEIAEYDPELPIRKAAIRSLGELISIGVEQGLEDFAGADTSMDYAEEWEEYQTGSLRDEYLRVKNLLLGILDIEDDPSLVEVTVAALADLGYIHEVREKISELYHGNNSSGKLVALQAMGKYPHFWEDELVAAIRKDQPAALLKEAVSAGFSSNSLRVSEAIEKVLDHEDLEVVRYALMSLSNIDLSPNLMEIFQRFRRHSDPEVQAAAQEGLDRLSRLNLGDFMRDELGFEG
jgi:hypothetical protein